MDKWLRQVPGFRSGKSWRKLVAIVGYGCIGLLAVAGFAGNVSILLFAFWALTTVFLVFNAWHLRERTPVLRSANKAAAAWGWFGLMVVGLALFVLGSSQPGSESAATARSATPTPVQAPAVTPRASDGGVGDGGTRHGGDGNRDSQ